MSLYDLVSDLLPFQPRMKTGLNNKKKSSTCFESEPKPRARSTYAEDDNKQNSSPEAEATTTASRSGPMAYTVLVDDQEITLIDRSGKTFEELTISVERRFGADRARELKVMQPPSS